MKKGTKKTQSVKKQSTKKSSARAGRAPDILKLLKEDHRRVKKLVETFESTRASARKKKIADEICGELTLHATLEEEIFYPALRNSLKQKAEDLLDEAAVEHETVKQLIAQISGSTPEAERYDAMVKVLGEYVEHHVKEEEKEIFPKAKKSKLDLQQLGEQLTMRKQELQSGGRQTL